MPAVQRRKESVIAIRDPSVSSVAKMAISTSPKVNMGSDSHSGVNYEALRLWGCGLWT